MKLEDIEIEMTNVGGSVSANSKWKANARHKPSGILATAEGYSKRALHDKVIEMLREPVKKWELTQGMFTLPPNIGVPFQPAPAPKPAKTNPLRGHKAPFPLPHPVPGRLGRFKLQEVKHDGSGKPGTLLAYDQIIITRRDGLNEVGPVQVFPAGWTWKAGNKNSDIVYYAILP